MLLKQLISEISVKQIEGPAEGAVEGIAYVSGAVKKNYLFAAMRGVKTDGHLYIEEAIKKGATAILCEAFIPQKGELTARSAFIQVENSRKAFAQVACRYYDHPSRAMGVIGVTGTNGKTTTSFLIRRLMEFHGPTGLIGTVGNWIGTEKQISSHTTPESSDLQCLLDQMKRKGIKNAVMEVSSHSLELDRVFGTFFDTAVFTNLTQDHLEFHHTLEAYFQAKSKLFRFHQDAVSASKKPLALINIDDAWGTKLKSLSSGEIWTYGLSQKADLRAENIRVAALGSSFEMKTPAGNLHIRSPLVGTFNVYNLLAAAGTAIRHRVPPDAIEEILSGTIVIPGRLEKIPGAYPFSVFVDYAHTEDALLKILTTLQEIKKGRIILVFGCGGDRDKGKRPKMGKVAGEYADSLVLTSDNPRSENPFDILKEVEAGIHSAGRRMKGKYRVIESRREAIESAIGEAEPGDFVVIAGKGHEDYQMIGEKNFPFNDRLVAKDILRKKFGF
jgi:UDP-N-acetylmuramoyl-L-alanyl-D-glutamate--2,6-diaminopimelate ligase